MNSATPEQVALVYIKKAAEQAKESMPVSSIPMIAASVPESRLSLASLDNEPIIQINPFLPRCF